MSQAELASGERGGGGGGVGAGRRLLPAGRNIFSFSVATGELHLSPNGGG